MNFTNKNIINWVSYIQNDKFYFSWYLRFFFLCRPKWKISVYKSVYNLFFLYKSTKNQKTCKIDIFIRFHRFSVTKLKISPVSVDGFWWKIALKFLKLCRMKAWYVIRKSSKETIIDFKKTSTNKWWMVSWLLLKIHLVISCLSIGFEPTLFGFDAED